ncbi:lactonase family protein [Halosquirtibacter xylanolyticus]|uniref:lactonase family protein n=1 Tax=Halosquirtibacter xylanolyticus TaxID=3374599 RepID=UPI0037494C32|nr:lactonase family protein [Prolixibacteraceae bacterium]
MKKNSIKIFLLMGVLISFLSCKSNSEEESLYIGTYTNGTSDGVYTVDINHDKLYSHLKYRLSNPSYLALGDRYSVFVEEEVPKGKIVIDGLREMDREVISSQGGAPCYISISPSSRYIAWANYLGGKVVVYDVKQKREIVYQHTGQGPVVDRQDASHMHCAVWSSKEDMVFTVDLGGDKIDMCSLDFGEINTVFKFPGGSGPRHMVFTKDGQYALVSTELSNELYLLKWNETTSVFDKLQVYSTLRGDGVTSYAAAVKLSKDENFVYVSNRGENNIVRFIFDKESVEIKKPKWFDVKGDFPRDFALNKTNTVMAVANQKSQNVTLFDIDSEGCLSYQNRDINLDQPVFVKFYTHQ